LMITRSRDAIELHALLKANGNSIAPRELHDLFSASVLAAFRYEYMLDRPCRLQGFAHGVNTGQLVHGLTSVAAPGLDAHRVSHAGLEEGEPPQASARSLSSLRSRAFSVSAAARSNSTRASSSRPSLKRKSPRTLGNK